MAQTPPPTDLAQLWRQRDPGTLPSRRLQALNTGSATDWGMSSRPLDPNIRAISLAGGMPDSATLPRRALVAAMAEVLDLDPTLPLADLHSTEAVNSDGAPLSYGGPYGYEPLRAEIARHFARDHDPAIGADHIVLTNGAAGAIDLICSALLDPGDVVVSEVPAFSGSLRTIRGHQARLVGVPMDRQGMRLDALQDTLRELDAAGTPAKLIYLSPTFQNPTGTTMPVERRRQLIELAAHHGALLLEDTAYDELSFDGDPPPTLGALAQGHFVATVGTFSKVIAPGLRVGWLMARPELVRLLMPARFDMGNSPLLHRTIHRLMLSGELERHVLRMRSVYRDKMQRISAALRASSGDALTFDEPEGGFFLWARLAARLDATAVRERARDAGLTFPIGSAFYLPEGPQEEGQHIRLAYSRSTIEELEIGAERLAACLRE
jgi:DNA-binding transcriptional MocR family regulator